MRCKHCGNEVKSDYKFCPFCASRLMQDFEGHFEDLEPLVLSEDPAQWEILYEESQETEPPSSAIFGSQEYSVPQQEFKTGENPASPPAKRPYQIYRPAGEPLNQVPPVQQKIKNSPLDMDDERVSNAPYVSMKPETTPMESPYPTGRKSPGPVFKAFFILFIVLAALLTSVAAYWLAFGNEDSLQTSASISQEGESFDE